MVGEEHDCVYMYMYTAKGEASYGKLICNISISFSIIKKTILKGNEVGMAGPKSTLTGIITSTIHPYACLRVLAVFRNAVYSTCTDFCVFKLPSKMNNYC
jgi:hypothetical protein